MELRSGTVVAHQQRQQQKPLLSEEGMAMFQQGVTLLLGRWTALQLAVQNEWGGSSSQQKAQQLHSEIVAWMAQSKGVRYIDELEDMLDENMVLLFNTETEDGSLEEVAEKLMSIYEECLEGNFATIHNLASSGPNAYASTLASHQGEDIINENLTPLGEGSRADMEMDMDENLHELEPLPANGRNQALAMDEADGWTLVSSKSKQRSKRT